MLTDVVEAPACKDYDHHPQPQCEHSHIAGAGHNFQMFLQAWDCKKSPTEAPEGTAVLTDTATSVSSASAQLNGTGRLAALVDL